MDDDGWRGAARAFAWSGWLLMVVAGAALVIAWLPVDNKSAPIWRTGDYAGNYAVRHAMAETWRLGIKGWAWTIFWPSVAGGIACLGVGSLAASINRVATAVHSQGLVRPADE